MDKSGTSTRKFAIPSQSLTERPWLLESVFVIKSGSVYRAQPPAKHVQSGQEVCWDGMGKVLELPPQQGLRDIVYNDDKTKVTAIVCAEPGTYFEYLLKCDGQVVEGNSPPVIIVDPTT